MRCIAVTYGVHDAHTLARAEPTWLADSFDHVIQLITGGLPPARPEDLARLPGS
jgi:hypothetical protein